MSVQLIYSIIYPLKSTLLKTRNESQLSPSKKKYILTIINIYCFEFENVTFVYLYDLNIHISPNNLNHQEGKWVIFQNWVIGKLMLYRKLMSYSRSSLILHFLMFEFEIANQSLLRCPSPLARCAIKEVTISSQNWGSPCFGQTSKCQSRSRAEWDSDYMCL